MVEKLSMLWVGGGGGAHAHRVVAKVGDEAG